MGHCAQGYTLLKQVCASIQTHIERKKAAGMSDRSKGLEKTWITIRENYFDSSAFLVLKIKQEIYYNVLY